MRALPLLLFLGALLPLPSRAFLMPGSRAQVNRATACVVRDPTNARGANVNASNQLSTSVDAALPTGTNTLGSVKLTDGTTVPGVIVGTTALKTDLSSVAGTATSTAAAGVAKVGLVGNAGAALDAAGQNVASPANELLTGCQFNTSPTTITNGNMSAVQCTAAANLKTDVTTMNGVATTMGNGASGTGVQRVTVASDSTGTTAVTQATASNLNAQVVGAAASGASKAGNPVQVGGVYNSTQPTVTTGQAVEVQSTARGAQIVATGTDTLNATINAALPTGTNTIGSVKQTDGTNTVVTDPCMGQTKSYKSINISTAATTNLVTGTSAKKVYICSLMLVTNAAGGVTLIDGTTGGTCSSPSGMSGGTSSTTGWMLAANGGLTFGNGQGAVFVTSANANDVCLITQTATQLSGTMSYVVQ